MFKFGLALAALAGMQVPGDAPRNPVLSGADPELVAACGGWWIYPTTQATGQGRRPAPAFHAWTSPDLTTWRQSPPILSMDAIRWIKDDRAPRHTLWAPALATANGRYYFYYSVGPQNPTPARIGVAVGTSPAGPFTDSGRPLLTGGRGFEAIDPMVFTDSRSGKAYLYAGGSAGATLRVFELDRSMVRLAREVPIRTPYKFTEGAFVHERQGTYYLSYSHGRWNGPDYSVHYATASSPEGPWIYRGEILKSDATHQGPGHHSFARNGADGWFIAYHRWDRTDRDAPFTGRRVVAIETVRYGPQGRIKPIRMTDGPPPRSSLPASDCAAPAAE